MQMMILRATYEIANKKNKSNFELNIRNQKLNLLKLEKGKYFNEC